MRTTILSTFLSVFAIGSAAQHEPAQSAAGSQVGRILAVGGGGTTDAVVARALELAGGPKARILIVPQASGADDAGAKSVVFWREKGALDVQVLALEDHAAALKAIAAADFLWMPGGDQNRLMKALLDEDVLDAIRARYQSGALVGGTSAGAAVLSATMIIGGDRADLESVRSGGTEVAEGLGLWAGVIVDQHFLKRQRFNRLLAGVLDHPELVGIGIDERTGVVVHPDGSCEVVGDGGVLVIDARGANRRSTAPSTVHSADGMKLAIHRAGDTFTLAVPEQR
jgi:cyanophycinase